MGPLGDTQIQGVASLSEGKVSWNVSQPLAVPPGSYPVRRLRSAPDSMSNHHPPIYSDLEILASYTNVLGLTQTSVELCSLLLLSHSSRENKS